MLFFRSGGLGRGARGTLGDHSVCHPGCFALDVSALLLASWQCLGRGVAASALIAPQEILQVWFG